MRMRLPVIQESSVAPVTTLMIYLTEWCNLRCSYCFVSKTRRRMTAETATKVAEFIFRPDVSGSQEEININFFGGEPFLELERMEQLVALIQRLASQNKKKVLFSVTTNGTLFSRRAARLIEQAEMCVLYSLDGDPEASAERPMINGRSSHQHALANLPQFMQASQGRLMIRSTFHAKDYRLRERVEFLAQQQVRSIALCPVLEDDWEPHVEALEHEYQRLADWFIEQWMSGKNPPLELTWMYLRQWQSFQQGGHRPERPCQVGHSLLGISPEGHVMPCHRFLYRPADWLGTVDKPDISRTARHNYLGLSSSLIPDCENCVARPICGGGCRVAALQQGLGLQDAYQGHCIPMRAHAKAVYRIYSALQERGWRRPDLSQRAPIPISIQELITS